MTELERRQQLSRLTKAELVDWIIQIETAQTEATTALTALRNRVHNAYEEQ